MMKKKKKAGKTERSCGFAGGIVRGAAVTLFAGGLLLLPGAAAAFRTADPERLALPLALSALYLGALFGGVTAMRSVRASGGEVSGFLAAVCSAALVCVLLLTCSAVWGEGERAVWQSLLLHLAVIASSAFGAVLARPGRKRRRR